MSFSPDGHWLCFNGMNGTLHVYEVESRRLAHVFTAGPDSASTRIFARVSVCEWESQSRWFTRVDDGINIKLIEPGTWRTIAELRGPLEVPVMSVKITPDGSTLLVLRRGGSLERWDLRALGEELHAMGVAFVLPPPTVPPPTAAGLDGSFDVVVPPKTFVSPNGP